MRFHLFLILNNHSENLIFTRKIQICFGENKRRISADNWMSRALRNSSEQSSIGNTRLGSFSSPIPVFPLLLTKPAKITSKTKTYLFLYINILWTFTQKNCGKCVNNPYFFLLLKNWSHICRNLTELVKYKDVNHTKHNHKQETTHTSEDYLKR